MPLNETTGNQTLRTPSRIPINTTGTPRPGRTPVSRLETPKIMDEPFRPNTTEISSSNAQNAEAGRTVVVVKMPSAKSAPSSQPQPSAMPTNMTINVNVNGSIPQSPKQTTQDPNVNSKSTRNATKRTRANRDNGNSSNESLITNDSDSDGNQTNSSGQCDTPVNHLRKSREDASHGSARRNLFGNGIDNLTKTILSASSITSPASIQNHSNGIRVNVTPRSQTFVKSKTSLPTNATYDVPMENGSARSQYHQNGIGIDTEQFLSDIALPNDSELIDGSRNSLADIPSAARLESMDSMQVTTEDNAMNCTDNRNINKSQNKYVHTVEYNPKSPRFDARLILPRIDTSSYNMRKNSTVNTCVSNASTVFGNNRNKLSNILTPPVRFMDSIYNENGSVDVISPTTGERELRKSVSNFHIFESFFSLQFNS